MEPVRFHIGEWKEAGFWAGGILNILLYVPFGYTGYNWKAKGRKETVCLDEYRAGGGVFVDIM